MDINLKLEFVVIESNCDFYSEICCSTHFYVNIFKHKPHYIQLTFK